MVYADGSSDNVIKPEGLPNYDVSPPSCLYPSSQPVINDSVSDQQDFGTVLFSDNTVCLTYLLNLW